MFKIQRQTRKTCLKDKQYKCCEENMFKRQTVQMLGVKHVEKTNSTMLWVKHVKKKVQMVWVKHVKKKYKWK